jgi:Spy/CpxP family protein refolding chaperone
MARPSTFSLSPLSRLAAGAVLVVGGILASTAAMNAQADTKPAPPAGFQQVAHQPDGPGGKHAHGRHGRHGGGPGGILDPRRLDRLLDEVNATETQRTQIRQISEAAREDLRKLHQGGGNLRGQSLALLTQPQIDTAAAEAVRQQMLARQDAMSKRTLTAMLDVAQVLTPAQRTQLGEKMKERQQKMEQRRAQRAQAGTQPGSERQ